MDFDADYLELQSPEQALQETTQTHFDSFSVQKCMEGVSMQTADTMTEKYGMMRETQLMVQEK
jgi:hypothetical protein